MDKRINEGEVYFGLFGVEFDPSIASDAILLDWAVTKEKGEFVPKRSSWRCSTGNQKSECIDIYDMASTLVSRLVPHTSEIVAVKERYKLDAVLQVVLRISTSDELSIPAIGFDRKVLEFIHSVGATIDVDTYLNSN